jgi:hypothetical protein
MSKLLKLSLLALPLLAVPSRAHAWGCGPLTIEAGFNWYYKVHWGCPAMAGPWYLYWPTDAQAQTLAASAGPSFPYWPNAGLAAGVAPGAPYIAPPPTTASFQPASFSGEAPSYWYGR